ncbi:MAG: aromatic ring-hydroxylating dioxygenase subunit alpha, partial [Pseudomonadota bacterium]
MTIHSTKLPQLSAEEIARVRQPLEQAYTLPPTAYTDPDVYEREVALIMRKSWLPLARVDQVAKPGDYISLDLFGQPVMVVHGKDGEIRTMSRVCLHRAAPLTEDGAGHRNLFTCPYHAWSYDTAGDLVRTPLMEGANGFDEMSATEKGCRLPQIRTEVWNGFIMANLDEDAEPFAPQVAGFTRFFDKFNLDDLVVVKTLDFPSNWNWKVLVENFMEAYHHIATHATTFGPVFPAAESNVPDND